MEQGSVPLQQAASPCRGCPWPWVLTGTALTPGLPALGPCRLRRAGGSGGAGVGRSLEQSCSAGPGPCSGLTFPRRRRSRQARRSAELGQSLPASLSQKQDAAKAQKQPGNIPRFACAGGRSWGCLVWEKAVSTWCLQAGQKKQAFCILAPRLPKAELAEPRCRQVGAGGCSAPASQRSDRSGSLPPLQQGPSLFPLQQLLPMSVTALGWEADANSGELGRLPGTAPASTHTSDPGAARPALLGQQMHVPTGTAPLQHSDTRLCQATPPHGSNLKGPQHGPALPLEELLPTPGELQPQEKQQVPGAHFLRQRNENKNVTTAAVAIN